MKLGFCSNAFTRFPLEAAIDAIAASGYDGLEVLADVPHLFVDRLDLGRLDALRQYISRNRLAVANINANTASGFGMDVDGFEPSLINPNAALRRKRVEYTCNAIRAAQALGGDCVAICTGCRKPGQTSDQAQQLFEQSLAEILPVAEACGVRLGIEYEPGLWIEDHRAQLALLHRLKHPLLGANLDLGHAVVMGEDPVEVIRALRGRIWHAHLEDIRDRVHEHLIPGQGDIDFAAIFAAFREIGYDRFVSFELYPYKEEPAKAAAAAMAFARRHGFLPR